MPAPRPSAHPVARSFACQGAGTLLLATCLLALPKPAQTAETAHSASPAAAQTSPAATSPTAPAALRSYQPKPSETLDQVIAHTMPESPLKIELLRQAFIAQNPQAIAPGKVPKLRKGMVLRVPDHGELLRTHLGPREPVAETVPAAVRLSPSTSEERRHWVQFP